MSPYCDPKKTYCHSTCASCMGQNKKVPPNCEIKCKNYYIKLPTYKAPTGKINCYNTKYCYTKSAFFGNDFGSC